MEEKKIKKKSIITFLALIFFLIILPLGSWYYLDTGLKFRVQNLEELAIKGEIQLKKEFFKNQDLMDSLQTTTKIFGIKLNSDDEDNIKFRKHTELIQQRFEDRIDFDYLEITIKNENQNETHDFYLNDTKRHFWTAEWDLVTLNSIGVDTNNKNMPFWILVDDKYQIRRYYSLDEIEKLFVHAALILPIKKREKIDLVRDQEK